MSRHAAQRERRHIFRSRLAPKVKLQRPSFEWLEDRTLLANGGLPAAIVLGRTLATPSTAATSTPSPSYFVGEVENNQVTITYTVYNEQADTETGVLLTTTLEKGVTFVSSSVTLDGTTTAQLPDQSGPDLAWSLAPISGYDRESVAVTVSLINPIPMQLDSGAQAFATLDAGAVSAVTPAATLQAGNTPTDAEGNSLLESTPDADTDDPFIQEEAAALNYDPTQIFDFLHTQIGYNSYYGSLRGARGTLWSSAGNALDVASLGIALLRASGIPAQYEQGTLSQSEAQSLILSMFPGTSSSLGFVPANTPLSDPADDPQLLAETESHFWFQFDAGNVMVDADPLMPGATVGQTFTASTGAFTEVPQSLRGTAEVQLSAETYNQADALFGLGGLSTSVVLDQTFNDVDLVGTSLSIGNLVSSSTVGALTFTSMTNTYTPYLTLNEEGLPANEQPDPIYGTPYQEVLTSFPFGNEILTGLFLNVATSVPSATGGVQTQTVSKTLFDRIGYAARQSGATGSISVSPSAGPAFSDLDVMTLQISTSTQIQGPQAGEDNSDAQLSAQLSALQPALNGPNASLSDAETAHLLAKESIDQTTASIGSQFLAFSDDYSEGLGQYLQVISYFSTPRIVAVSSTLSFDPSTATATNTLAVDILQDTPRCYADPGQNQNASLIACGLKGLFDSALEGSILSDFQGANTSVPLSSLETYIMAEDQPGNSLLAIDSTNLQILSSLNLSADAQAHITSDVNGGDIVILPVIPAVVNGSPSFAWLDVNTSTGLMIAESEDGVHQGITEQAFQYVTDNEAAVGELSAQELGSTAASQDIAQAMAAWRAGNYQKAAKIVKDIKIVGFLTSVQRAFAVGVYSQLTPALNFLRSQGFDPPAGSMLFSQPSALPPLSNPALSPDALAPAGNNTASATQMEPASSTGGATTANVAAPSVQVAGSLDAQWQGSTGTSSFLVNALVASSASVSGDNGNVSGSGSIALSTTATIAIALSGNNQYVVSGTGSLSVYASSGKSLAVSADWSAFAATVTGGVTIMLTVPAGALTLNGQALAAGTYTITTNSATLSGSGTMSSPNFAGSASITTANGTLNVGPGNGRFSVGGKPLNSEDETTLDGYTGTIIVSANGDDTDSVSLNGNAGNVLQVTTTPATLTTDQNTPITFATNVQTSLADTYNLTANAPAGWTVSIDSSGNVTATPAPGLQSGTYPIQIIAQSQTDANLIAQTTVEVTIKPTQPGITFAVSPDKQFTVPFNGAQLPTAFRATIQNLGPAADTYNLAFSNVPTGFTLLNSGTSVTVPAGETGILGIYLQPNTGQPIPPPGTQLSFTVTATSTSDSSITKTQTVTFTVPEIDAVTLTSTPTSLSSSPGVAATTTLTLQNDGNAPETVTLAATTPSGLTASSLTAIPLAVGATQTETLTLTPAASAALNQTLEASITATYGPEASPVTATDEIDLLVQSAQAAAISTTSVAASAANNSQLASVLTDLSTTLESLQSATSSALFTEAQTDLANLSKLLSADPALAPFVTQLQPIITAANSDDLDGMLSGSTSLFDSITSVLEVEATEQFTIAVTPIEADLDLGQGETLSVQLTDTGNDPETLDLSAGSLPTGVSVVFGQNSVSLSPNQSMSVPVTLSQTLQTETYFELNVTAAATVVHHTDSAMIAVRPSVADVLSVTASPAAINAGDPVSVSAQVFNTANVSRSVEAQVSVLDGSGNPVGSPTDVPVSLVPGNGDLTLSLGQVATTGLANGLYTVKVSLVTSDGSPLPGQSSQTDFEIGEPVTASVAGSTAFVPPGTSTVTTTISVTNQNTATASTLAVGDVEAFYDSKESQALFGVGALDGTVFAIENASSAPITGGVLTINPPGGPEDSFDVGTVPARQFVLVEPGISNDGGSNHTFFKVTGTLRDESDLGPNSNDVQFEFTGLQGTSTIDSGIFTPAATAGPSNDGTVQNLNFLGGPGDNDGPVTDGFGPKVVASLTATPAGGSTPQSLPIAVEVGYADSVRPSGFFPVPWYGAPNTIFDGEISNAPGAYDGGAILITNATNSPITVNNVSVDEEGVVFDLWGSNVVPAGANLILTETNGANFDTSDEPHGGYNGGELPYPLTYPVGETLHATQITITVNGVQLPTFLDTGHILDTGGSDLGYGNNETNNESQNWRPIGTTGINNPGGSSVSLTVTHNLPSAGYDIDSTTISPAPTSSSSSQIVWNAQLLAGGNPSEFELIGTVPDMAPGEVRQISLGTNIAATTVTATGQQITTTLTLPPVTVAAEHIISIDPGTQTVDLDGTATFTVSLTNPLPTDEIYTLSTTGLDGLTVGLATSIAVPAGQTVTTPLTIAVPADELADRLLFTVNVQTLEGARDSAEGQLIIAPQVALQPRAASLVINPTQATAGQGAAARYVLTVSNLGSVEDTYSLSTVGLPAGVKATFGETTIDVPPGVSNFRDVPLTLSVPKGTTPDSYPFTVTATSTSDPTVISTTNGTLIVTAGGVEVTLNPDSGAPGSAFQATVTNTGTTTDTYNLALAGPAALVSNLATNEVTLAAGASKVVPIATGAVDFAVKGALNLVALATSTSNTAIRGAASADLAIPATAGMTAEFSPATQTRSSPGVVTFLLMVHNTGNTEDSYSATIVSANGPITANLIGLDGSPTQSIPTFILPGLSTGAIELQADLSAVGQGTITVMVKSLTNSETASPIAMTNVTPATTATDGPEVVDVLRYGYHDMPTTIVLTFNQALDSTTADDAKDYRIIGPAGRIIRLKSAVYNAAANTVTLRPRERINIHYRYTLIVEGSKPGGLANTKGQLLDGTDSGKPGSNFRIPITWRNLVLDPPPHKGKTPASTVKEKPEHFVGHKALFTRSPAFRH